MQMHTIILTFSNIIQTKYCVEGLYKITFTKKLRADKFGNYC